MSSSYNIKILYQFIRVVSKALSKFDFLKKYCHSYHTWYSLMVMPAGNEQIGQLISQIRQERGLTQSEFAKRLKTSQSAINRIEHGRQNLSLDTLGRISDVLNKQLISLSEENGVSLLINGGHSLHGNVTLK